MLVGYHSKFFLLCCCVLCGIFSGLQCASQTHDISDADLPALLARVKANAASNGKLTQQYTSDELWHNRNFDKNGKATVDESAKYENVFVEGLPYRKKVEANGKPLTGKEAAAEEKRYVRAVQERRAMTRKQKWLSLHKEWHSSLPMCCLATLFANRIVGREQIEGRDRLIIESVPLPDAKPSNDDEKSSLDWKQKSWIDIADTMFARVEVESLSDKNHMAKGTTIHMDFDRVIDTLSGEGQAERAVWLLRNITSQFRFKMLWIGLTGTTEQSWSNYKKFHVDMRILEDSIEPIAEGSAAQSQP